MNIKPHHQTDIIILPSGLMKLSGALKLPADQQQHFNELITYSKQKTDPAPLCLSKDQKLELIKMLAAMGEEVRASKLFQLCRATEEQIKSSEAIQNQKAISDFIEGHANRPASTCKRYALTLSQFFIWLYASNNIQALKSRTLNLDKLKNYNKYLVARMGLPEDDPLQLSRNTVMSYLTAMRQFFKTWEATTATTKNPIVNHAHLIKNPSKPEHVVYEREALDNEAGSQIFKNLHNDVLKAKQAADEAAAAFKYIGYKGQAGRKAEAARNKTHRKYIEALRNRAIIALMGYEGFRVSTIQELKAKHVIEKHARKGLKIFEKGKGKIEENRRPKSLLLTSMRYLSEYMEAAPIGKEKYLFHSLNGVKKGGQLSTVSISQIAKKQIKRIGLSGKQYTAHSLRHMCASILAEHNTPTEAIQRNLGHKSIQTTENYIKDNNNKKDWINPPHAVLESAAVLWNPFN